MNSNPTQLRRYTHVWLGTGAEKKHEAKKSLSLRDFQVKKRNIYQNKIDIM